MSLGLTSITVAVVRILPGFRRTTGVALGCRPLHNRVYTAIVEKFHNARISYVCWGYLSSCIVHLFNQQLC